MDTRYATSPEELPLLDTAGLRRRFLVEDVFRPGEVTATYSHQDRVVLVGTSIQLQDELTDSDRFLHLGAVGIALEHFRESTRRSMSPGLAPSAIRTPISCVCCTTK